MHALAPIASKIKKTAALLFVTPFVFLYWTDSLTIDFFSLLLLILGNDLPRIPSIRRTVVIQLALYIYGLVYLVVALGHWTSEVDYHATVSVAMTLWYLTVSVVAFRTGRLLSPLVANRPLDVSPPDDTPPPPPRAEGAP